jgi:hypothetical protein
MHFVAPEMARTAAKFKAAAPAGIGAYAKIIGFTPAP